MLIMLVLMWLPLLALPVFWCLPLAQSIPIYFFCLLLSGWMFWLMRRTDRLPTVMGSEALLGQETKVISKSDVGSRATYFIRIRGELWEVRADTPIKVGDTVKIIAVENNRLKVNRQMSNINIVKEVLQ